MLNPKDIEGYEVALRTALTQRSLFRDVPCKCGILILIISLLAALALRMWLFGRTAGLILRGVSVDLTRSDADWLRILRSHLRLPNL